MRKAGMLFSLLAVMILMTSFTTPPAETIKWYTFEEAVQLMKKEKRKMFIDVYTDWCGWCKVMDKNTFTDPTVIKLMNEKFYAVKFNAEQREDVVFEGRTFKFVPSGRSGYHELAASLLNNKLGYPNFVFLNDEFQIVPVMQGSVSLPGYHPPSKFHFYLSFVGEDHFKKMKVDDYGKVYKSPYPAEIEKSNP